MYIPFCQLSILLPPRIYALFLCAKWCSAISVLRDIDE